MRLHCTACGKSVSTEVPDDTIVRAILTCPECVPQVIIQRRMCQRCQGCGQIANDDEGTPWTYWAEMPVANAFAVVAGIVRPMKCPDCDGVGKVG